jgi:integrase
MANSQAALSLVSEPQRSGVHYWRAYFPDPITGKRRKLSTGIEDDGTKASWAEAQAMALRIIETARIPIQPPAPALPTFASYSRGFWDWETSTYVAARLARDPKAFSQEHCRNQTTNLRKHALPILGPLLLNQVTPAVLDDLVTTLLGRVSSQTVKHVIDSVNPILTQAVREGRIQYNPIPSMMPFTARHQKRDAFTPEEVAAILSPRTVAKVWSDSKGPKAYRSGWLYWGITMLCFVTGARFGAVAALRREDLIERTFAGQRYWEVHLERSLSAIRGIKEGSKTGKGTVVPVAAELVDLLLPHVATNGQLFASFGEHGVISHHTAVAHLHEAIRRLEIPDDGTRLLGFHALRHAFVTQASAAGMTDKQIQAFTEHAEESTTDRYRHLRPVDLLAAIPVQMGFMFA